MNDREYWLAKFPGEWPRTAFPADLDGSATGGSGGDRLEFIIAPEPGRRLLEIANRSDLRLYIFLATALSVLVYRYTGEEDVVLGAPIYRQPEQQNFINTVVAFRLQLAPQLPFKGLLLAMGEEIFSANEHQNYPLGELTGRLKPDDPLFGLAVLLENIHEPKYIEDLHLDMVFSLRRQQEGVRAEVRYDRRLYSGQMVERLTAHFHRLLAVVVFDPDVPIGKIDFLSAQERRHLLHHLNDTQAAYPKEATLRALFERQVEAGPGRTALVEEEGQAANRHLTYGALNQRANRLGCCLQKRGVGPGEIVGILLERSLELFIGILGVLKAGGAYLPLDPHYPRSRILFILADCRVSVLLDTPAGEPTGGAAGNPGQGERPTDLCYVIYTSGSTGRPKGVAVEQHSAAAYVQAFLQEFDLRPEDTVLQQASPAFDAFVEEMFPVLSRGGKLAIPADWETGDVNRLARFIGRQRVSVVTCSPLLLNALNQLEPFDALDPVHTFISGGDVLRAEYVGRLRQKGKVYNSYGPTETTVCATFHRYRGDEGSRPAIGRPIANYRVYILDGNRQLLPQGVPGELYIGGDGLSRGYLNNPELTAKKFLNAAAKNREGTRSPKNQPLNPKSQPLYRTGDRARWLPGGTLDFLGRIDRQVKIRGYRIELAEIENRLRGCAEIEEALVTVRTDKTGDRYLCGYVVPRAGLARPALEPARLKEHLAGELPAYMVPAHFVQLKAIPQTAAGKPDLRALPVAMDGYLPLSHAQRLIYLTEKIYPATSCETVAFTVNYGRELDRARLEQAVNLVIRKNEGLRLRIEEVEIDGTTGPVQYVADFKAAKLDYLDFSGAGGEERLSQWIAADVRRPFKLTGSDLFYFALVKFAGGEMGCYVKLHHLISDVWTFTLIFREIGQIYRHLEEGRPVDTGPNPSYRQYVRDEGAYLKSDRFRRDRQFWHKTLFPLPPETDIFFRQDDARGIEGDSLTLPFSRELRGKMHEYCRDQRTSIYKLVLSALSIYISKLTAEDDVVIGSVNHNRSTAAHRQMSGIFIAIFPVRIRLSPQVRFRDFVAQVGKNLDSIIKNHRRYPFDILAADIRKQGRGEAAALLNVNLIGHRRSDDEPFTVSHHFQGYEANPLSIHLDFSNRDAAGVLELEWDFQVRYFSRPDIAALHRGLAGLLEALLDCPDRRLADVNPPFPGEEAQDPDRRQQWLQRRRQRQMETLAAKAADRFDPRCDGGDGQPADEVERRVLELWQEVLGIEADKIAMEADFFDLGGHSLKATILTVKIQKAFKVNISLAQVFKTPTIRGLSKFIRGASHQGFAAIEPARPKEYYALSSAQKRMYIQQQLDPASTNYNTPRAVVLEGTLRVKKLAGAFSDLINRHESLRTSFRLVEDEPRQQIHEAGDLDFAIEHFDGGPALDPAVVRNFIRPFTLSKAPILRVGLIKSAADRHVLVLDMHHIVTDGFSMNIFFKDLLALYQGRPLSPLRLQYKDYSEWQNSEGQRQAVREQEQYWLRLFDGEIPVLALPTDYPRSALRQFDGDSVDFEIDRRETEKLKKLAADEAVTLYILMLTIFNVLLYKLSGQEDVVVGTGISGRSHADLSGIVGMFVNMLALRNFPRGEETFSRFLQAVKGRTVEAFENQDYQFENLVEKIVTLRQPGRSPLFDVVFQLQNPEVLSADIAAQEIPGLKLRPFDCGSKTSKFDLVLVGVEAGDRILFSLEFCTKLFKRQKIEKFIRFFREISARVVENWDIKLKDIAVTHDLRPINGVMPEDEPGDFDFPDK